MSRGAHRQRRVDVFDPRREYLFSIADLPGVAGALVSDEAELVFSSIRPADTIGVFPPGTEPNGRQVVSAGAERPCLRPASGTRAGG